MNRRQFVLALLPAVSALGLSTQCRADSGGGQSGGDPIDVVEAFGFVPDGRTDNYDAFHRWAAHVNRERGGNYVFPRGTYHVGRYRTWPDKGAVVQNAPLMNCDGLTISGEGARIRLNGAFHRRKGAGRDFAAFIPLMLLGCRNVRISGFEIDGGVRAMRREAAVTEAYSHLVAIHGCRGVVLEDLDLHHSQTDGVYLTSWQEGGRWPGRASRDITLRNVRSHNNARGGLGIIQAYGVTCTDCAFDENGRDLGAYSAHSPMFGATVEPDYVRPGDIDILTGNIEFRRCQFLDNQTAFSGVYRDRVQGYFRAIDCTSSNRTGGTFHIMLNWPGALITGGRHDCGTGTLWASWDGPQGGDLEIRDCEIRSAGRYGVFHAHAGNRLRMTNVRLIGTHREPGEDGWILAIQGDPGGGRRNLLQGCEVFVPAARKSGGHAYDYEVVLHHTLSRDNLFRTNLPATGGQHFCTHYTTGTVVRNERYAGTSPGPTDSFRPGHGSSHDTRRPFSAG